MDILLHSTQISYRDVTTTNRVSDHPSMYPPGVKPNYLERAEIYALKLVNGALNSVNKCNLPFLK